MFERLGLKEKDMLHRLVAGKYLKQLMKIHEQEKTIDISVGQLRQLCGRCPLPEVCRGRRADVLLFGECAGERVRRWRECQFQSLTLLTPVAVERQVSFLDVAVLQSPQYILGRQLLPL